MKPLAWIMTQPLNKDWLRGFLLLLLCLFSFHYVFLEKNKDIGIMAVTSETGSEYHFNKDEMTAHQKVTLGIPININKESSEGLTAIPGVGKSLARSITDERTKRNGFSDINELKSVPGIGEKMFIRISSYISL